MKKNIIVTIILLSIVLSITACSNSIDDTNLKVIKIDDIELGKSIDNVDFENYTKTDKFEEKENTYNFEEIRIETDENRVIKRIHANTEYINLYINDIDEFSTTTDVTNV